MKYFLIVILVANVLTQVMPAAEPIVGQTSSAVSVIPKEGLAFWTTAEDAVVEGGAVVRLKDRSGQGNDAVFMPDAAVPPKNPLVVRHEVAQRPVLRFDGRFTGYALTRGIANVRTLIYVVSKHPDSAKSFPERHVVSRGGKEKDKTPPRAPGFPAGWHWTDTIIEYGMIRGVACWFNGAPVDPYVSEYSFHPKLAVISLIPSQNSLVEVISRDRDIKDRSWFGDIAEIIIYTVPLAAADRRAVEAYLMARYKIEPFPPVIVPKEMAVIGHPKPSKTATAAPAAAK